MTTDEMDLPTPTIDKKVSYMAEKDIQDKFVALSNAKEMEDSLTTKA